MNLSPRSLAVLRARVGALVVTLCAGLSGGSAFGQALVDISSSPLYGRQPHPNVVVATSVEFPTVGAAYLNAGYTRASVYYGYFDPTKCYAYSTSNGGYFKPIGAADANHECSGAFSGNFMNWATMSAIDEFRYAMTGGNRDDENGPDGGTIVMRAYLPDGSINGIPSYYADDTDFPRLYVASGVTGSLTGNVANPATAVSGTYASTVLPITGMDSSAIYITSCRTQVFFSAYHERRLQRAGERSRHIQRPHQRLRLDRGSGPHRPLPAVRRRHRQVQAGRPGAGQRGVDALRGVRLPDGPQHAGRLHGADELPDHRRQR